MATETRYAGAGLFVIARLDRAIQYSPLGAVDYWMPACAGMTGVRR
jgi:hypothetical protein